MDKREVSNWRLRAERGLFTGEKFDVFGMVLANAARNGRKTLKFKGDLVTYQGKEMLRCYQSLYMGNFRLVVLAP